MEAIGRLRRFYSSSEHGDDNVDASKSHAPSDSAGDVEHAVDALQHRRHEGTFAWLHRRRSSLQGHLHHAWRHYSVEDEAIAATSSADDGTARGNKKGALKERIRAAVNNVRHGWSWKHAAHFDGEQPLWLLGHTKMDMARLSLAPAVDESDLADFYDAFSSRIWLTYRAGMAPMHRSGTSSLASSCDAETTGQHTGEGFTTTTDCGWGCMLRSGQMLAAQALTVHLLGAGWSMHGPQSESERRAHRGLIARFGDSPAGALGVHSLVRHARRYGKSVGEWYGPASVALLVRDAFRAAETDGDPILSQIRVHVARDCTVPIQEIDELCCENGTKASDQSDDSLQWKWSLFLIVPLRLGADKLNMLYASHIRTLFSLESCCGIIGGRPSHSMYFVGWHDRSLICLDPHFCQDAVDTDLPDFDISTYHCHWPRKLKFVDMDPSIAVGFFFRDRTAWMNFLDHAKHIVSVEGGGVSLRHALFSVVRQTADWRCRSPQNRRQSSTGAGSRRQSAATHGFELL